MHIDWRALTEVLVPLGLPRESCALLLHSVQHMDLKQGKRRHGAIVWMWIRYHFVDGRKSWTPTHFSASSPLSWHKLDRGILTWNIRKYSTKETVYNGTFSSSNCSRSGQLDSSLTPSCLCFSNNPWHSSLLKASYTIQQVYLMMLHQVLFFFFFAQLMILFLLLLGHGCLLPR